MNTLRIKISTYFNWTIFGYLMVVLTLSFRGDIVFGLGLGDLFLILILLIGTIGQFLLNFFHYRQKGIENREMFNWLVGIGFFIFAIIMTYYFTLGRGIENNWDGNILVK